MIKKTCFSCRHIQRCKYVSSKMLEGGDFCTEWLAAEPTDLEARKTIAREFGPLALRFILPVNNGAKIRRR